MDKIKVMTVFGTRPEANKMAPLIKKLEQSPHIESIVCVTGQHRQMLDQMLTVFGIKPDFDLNVMQDRQTISGVTVRVLQGMAEVFKQSSPNLVLVHGDPTTSFAAALAAFYAGIKTGHVEAGLRTYNKLEPFPEEMNRRLVASLADLHFAPTELAKQNLLKEGVCPEAVFVTGNTAIDAIQSTVRADYKFQMDALNHIDYAKYRVIAMTAHRHENLGEPMENICRAVKRIVDEYEDVFLINPVHLNPLVRNTVYDILGGHDRILLTEPIDMLDMHNLMYRSYLVFTDSGGLQEEATALNKPVVVLRNVTERPEGVDAGILKLAGTEENNIYNVVQAILGDKELYNAMASAKNPFGDGHAAKRIVDSILYSFGINNERPLDFI